MNSFMSMQADQHLFSPVRTFLLLCVLVMTLIIKYVLYSEYTFSLYNLYSLENANGSSDEAWNDSASEHVVLAGSLNQNLSAADSNASVATTDGIIDTPMYVSCSYGADYAMQCTYDTVCYNGSQHLVVMAEGEADLREYTADNGDVFKERNWNSDGSVWRRPIDSTLDSFEKNLGDHVRPYQSRRSFKAIARTSLEYANVTWIENDTYFVDMVHPWPHVYTDLVSALPMWNRVHDMLSGVTPKNTVGGIFMDHWKECGGVHREALLNSSANAAAVPLRYRGDIWDDEIGQGKETFKCLLEKVEPIRHDRLVCARRGHLLGASFVPATGSLSRRRLLTQMKQELGDPSIIHGQAPLPEATPIRVVVVDRKDAGYSRSFADPQRVLQTVQDSAARRRTGVDIQYVPELKSLSTLDQIKLFSEADVMIIAHGAGVAHCIWMKPNSALIEIIPYGWNSRSYREMYSGSGGYYQDVFAIPEYTAEEEEGEKGEKLRECVRTNQFWEESFYHYQQGCYNEVYKHSTVTPDYEMLSLALKKSYRHLHRVKPAATR